MAKLHPHLKHFIRSVIAAELNESSVGPSKKYEWKEGVMRELQEGILDNLDTVSSQEQLVLLVDRMVEEFRRKKLEPVIDLVSRTLKQIPLSVLQNRSGNVLQVFLSVFSVSYKLQKTILVSIDGRVFSDQKTTFF